ncbi:MAG: hypothetical protein ACW981_20970 [Candidatus Hodarchaeales archaeon]|jgi:hypothetical protein
MTYVITNPLNQSIITRAPYSLLPFSAPLTIIPRTGDPIYFKIGFSTPFPMASEWTLNPGNNYYTREFNLRHYNRPVIDGEYYFELIHMIERYPDCSQVSPVKLKIQNKTIVDLNYNFQREASHYNNVELRIENFTQMSKRNLTDLQIMEVELEVTANKNIHPRTWCEALDLYLDFKINTENRTELFRGNASRVKSGPLSFNLEDHILLKNQKINFSISSKNSLYNLTHFPEGNYEIEMYDRRNYLPKANSFGIEWNSINKTIINNRKGSVTIDVSMSNTTFLKNDSNNDREDENFFTVLIPVTVGSFTGIFTAILLERRK